jgi:hypothetical protein
MYNFEVFAGLDEFLLFFRIQTDLIIGYPRDHHQHSYQLWSPAQLYCDIPLAPCPKYLPPQNL